MSSRMVIRRPEAPRFRRRRPDDLPGSTPGNTHIVQFYDEDAFLEDVVARHLADGLVAEEPALVIATASHAAGIQRRLAARGLDVPALLASGRLQVLDARATLERILVDGQPDLARFETIFAPVLARAQAGTCHARIRAYGEMVDLLWRDGRPEAALRLEAIWNERPGAPVLALLCSYGMDQFASGAEAGPFDAVCHAHTHVLPTESYSRLEEPDARLREVSHLQQRARALEAELAARVASEAALRDALATREDFLAAAGHELKTPLTSVGLLLDSLADSGGIDESARTRVRLARGGIDRLTRLASELLDANRLARGPVRLDCEDVDLGALAQRVAGAAGPSARRAGCELRVTAAPGVRGCWDRARLERIVGHLLGNALKYGPGALIELEVARAGELARLVVRDHGLGIREEDQARIFERYERAAPSRHFGGLGLGLYAAARIVEAHGGAIRVESAPGRGAAFTIELPTRDADRADGC